MALVALLLVVCANPGPTLPLALRLTLVEDENGPPPGSAYPPPPPLVEDKAPPAEAAAPKSVMPDDADRPHSTNYPPPPRPLEPRELAPPPNPPPPEAPDVGARLLWGLGARGGLGDAPTEEASNGFGSVVRATQPTVDGSLYVRMGYDLNDLWGFEGEVHGGLLSLGGYVGGAVTIDATPVDWFTVALGPLLDEYETFASATSVGGTLRVDFHPWAARGETGRSAFTIGVVGNLAAALSQFDTQPVGGVYLTAGYAHY